MRVLASKSLQDNSLFGQRDFVGEKITYTFSSKLDHIERVPGVG